MNILAFETSCDETSAAIIQDGRRILTNVVASQIELHKRWGGVVPELASRQHILYIVPTLEAALKEASLTWRDIDAIAVTNGPGLAGALLVGVNVAKGLAFALGKPLLPVNHLEGHIYANWLIPNSAAKPKPVVAELPTSADAEESDINSEEPSSRQYRAAYEQSAPVYRPVGEPVPKPAPPPQPSPKIGEGVAIPPEPQFPIVALVVSGGHTELILMRGHGLYELLGKTIDDAAGEAFDKVGRILGLGYPGGPAIQKLVDAEPVDPRKIDLPRAWLRGTYDFSFSGLKTAVMRKIDEYGGLPVVDKPRPFAEVEAAQQRSDAAGREATSDSNSVRPGQSPTAMVSEPLAMPAPADQPTRQPQARGFQPPARLTRPAELATQPADPPTPPARTIVPPAPSIAPAQPVRPANPPRATTLPPAPAVEADDDGDEVAPEPSFRLGPQPPRDRLASLFVRDANETADDDEEGDDDDDEGDENENGNVQPPVSATPISPALERRPLRQAAPRPRAIYSMFDDEDGVEIATPAATANPPHQPTTTAASSPQPAPPGAVTGPGLERRPLRTVPTPDPRTAPQADDEDEDEDEQSLPRTLSPQGRAMHPPTTDQRSQPQPPTPQPNPPAQQRPGQPVVQPPAPQSGGNIYPRSTVLGSEPAPQRPTQQPPQQRPNQPAPQRPTQQPPASQRPTQQPPAQSRTTQQPPAQQRPVQSPAQQPSATSSAPPPLNRPRPLPPSQSQRGTYTRPGQLPQRSAPLAQREIIPVPKGSSADDDDRDERDYIDNEEDDTPRSRVGSAADDEDEPGDDDRSRRNRSLGADAPRSPGVRGSVGAGAGSDKKGHAPVALIAAAFQLAVVEVLVEKTAAAAEQYGARMVVLAGGVAANRLLREMMGERLKVPLIYPPMALCTDNAAMIGAAAYYRYYHAQGAARDRADTSDWAMDIAPNAHFLGEV